MCQVLRNTGLNTDWILYNDKLHIIMINLYMPKMAERRIKCQYLQVQVLLLLLQ